MNKVIKRINEEIEAQGISNYKMARLMKTSGTNIDYMRKCKSDIRLSTVLNACSVLGIETLEL